MNTKIFSLVQKNLHSAFNLPRYADISIDQHTQIDQLPWTPKRYKKFRDAIWHELQLHSEFEGTLAQIVNDLSERYTHRFFKEIWRPRTDDYDHSGWALVDEINALNPRSVLDVGCGYHPFRGRIHNLIGIDPYNDAADYEVDILDYCVKPGSHDVIIALGSINFNSKDEIEARFAHCVRLLETGGRFYLRANPGISHKTGPWVDIFPWNFAVANEFAERYGLRLMEFKKEPADLGRLYFVYQKL